MKIIFVLILSVSLLSIVACSSKDTAVKNEACIGTMGTTQVVCGEIAGNDFTDAQCATKYAELVSIGGSQGTLSAAVTCPAGFTANCDLLDSTGTTTKAFFYGVEGILLSGYACPTAAK